MTKKIEFHFDSPNHSPGYLLGQLAMLWQRKQKKTLDPLDLTHTQFVLLATLGWLSKHNDQVTQSDIANQSNADRMMVSKVLRALEAKKFINRQVHETDTRSKIISLTENGRLVLQKAIIKVESTDIKFFSTLEIERPTFNKNMLKLINQNNTGQSE